MNVLKLAVLFCLQLTFFAGYAQKNSAKFKHLTTSEGLSQNTVLSILKDTRGFMWFATEDGLNKYDGYQFTVYKNDTEKPSSIINSSVTDLMEDNVGNLWVVTAGGLDKFDRSSETFIHFPNHNSSAVFKNIFQDSKKRIWLGSTEGFCFFNPEKKIFKFYKNQPGNPNSLSQNFVYSIVEDNNGDLWLSTRNGLNRFNPEQEKFIHYFNDPKNKKSIGSGYIKSIYKDRKGNIWVGTQGSGVALYQPADNSFINYRHDPLNSNSISHNDILSFAEDADGKLWIGTENGGISVMDDANGYFSNFKNDEIDPGSLSNNSIYSLYKDDIGNMWVGTWSGGVNFMPLFGDKFRHFRKIPFDNNSLSNNSILSISGDSSGNIWIGTDGGGLNRFNTTTRKFTRYQDNMKAGNHIFNNYVNSVTEFKRGFYAIGFHRGGFDLFDIKNQRFTHYEPGATNTNRVTAASIGLTFLDRKGNLWLGANDNIGLFNFNLESKVFTRYAPDPGNNKGISGATTFAMAETRDGQLWIGGDRGLDRFDRQKNEFVHHQHDPKNKFTISNDFVFSILEDATGNLWLGTAGGLNYFNRKTNTFTSYSEKDGFPNNLINGVLQDKHGNLWVSSNKGLTWFDPETKSIRNYDVNDGLQSNTFKHKSAYQTSKGEMFFGGSNGFNSFYPDSIKDNTYIPPVYLTGFKVSNKPVGIGNGSPLDRSINEIKHITLTYKQSVFTLEFAALNFTQPEQNKYAYMLEGFDKEWTFSGSKRAATYTNLDAGTYLFKVKASNNDGVWNENGTFVKITILPPFWLTWWFKFIMVMLFISSCIAFYLFRINSMKQQKLLLQKKVKEQTLQLVHLNEEEHKARLEAEEARLESELARVEASHANDDLQAKNKELEQFAYVASHDLQEPLRTTASFVELLQRQYKGRLDDKADKYLAYISDASFRMKTLIMDLLDFSRIGTKGELEKIDCNHTIKNVLADLAIAIQESKAVIIFEPLPVIDGYATEIKLLFQNLVINAIKFRKEDTNPLITISAREDGDYWEFKVSDNGIGIDPQYNDRIFKIFQRLHSRSQFEGAGIGLAHCKKIVELHHGRIWIDSVLGKGSTFYFTIYSYNSQVLPQLRALSNTMPYTPG